LEKHAVVLQAVGKFPIVQMPQRKFPGLVIQGDTLNGLLFDIRRIEELHLTRDESEITDEINLLKIKLAEMQSCYETVCDELGIARPY
jgi:hypothetical protein